MVSRIPDVQAAVRALGGVEQATVRWPEPDGPATLHIAFEPDADREAVTKAVLETIAEVGGVDLGTLDVQTPSLQVPAPPDPVEPGGSSGARPDPPAVAAPGGAAGNGRPQRPPRPAFSGINVDRNDFDNTVTVTLRLHGREFTGQAAGLATRRATPRTAAAAVLLALRELLPKDARVELEWLDVVDNGSPGRPPIVQSAVTYLSGEGEQTFIGAALVRDDLREAAVRATLDALNRRLEDTLSAAG